MGLVSASIVLYIYRISLGVLLIVKPELERTLVEFAGNVGVLF